MQLLFTLAIATAADLQSRPFSTIRVVDAQSGEQITYLQPYEGGGRVHSITSDSANVWVVHDNHEVRIFDLKTRDLKATFVSPHVSPIQLLAAPSPDPSVWSVGGALTDGGPSVVNIWNTVMATSSPFPSVEDQLLSELKSFTSPGKSQPAAMAANQLRCSLLDRLKRLQRQQN